MQKWAAKHIRVFLRDMSTHIPGAIEKGSRVLPDVDMQELWTENCKKIIQVNNIRLRAFGLCYINGVYMLNNVLSKFTYSSELCSLCRRAKETFFHLAWTYSSVTLTIAELKDFCIKYAEMHEGEWSCKNYLFSNFSSKLLVVITLLFKRCLLVLKWRVPRHTNAVTVFDFKVFLHYLQNYIHIDHQVHSYANRLAQFH